MADFPDEIVYPSGIKVYIDRNRWLLGLKKPYTLNQVTSILPSSMTLESPVNPHESINHTNKKF